MIKNILPTATLIATFLTLSLHAAPTWAGKFYKWVDAEGVTHYSLHPPADVVETEALNIKTSKKSQPSEEEETDADAVTDADGETTTEEVTEEKAALSPEELAKIAKEEQANCDKARKNLHTLKNRTRIVSPDKKTGGKSYLSDQEREKWIAESNEVISEFCK